MATKPVYYTGEATDPISVRHLLKKRYMVLIRLVNSEGPRLGERLDTIVNNQQFADHVQEVVKDALKDNLKLQTGLSPNAQAFQKVSQSIFEPVPQMYLDGLKQTPSFKQLEQSLSTMEDDWNRTPCGVWLAHHPNGSKWLAVSGVLLAAGGLAALYTPKRANFVVNSLINGHKFDVVKSGLLDLAFTPEIKMATREVGIQSAMGMRLEGLEVKSDLSASFKAGFLEECEQSASVKIPLGKWSVTSGVFVDKQQDSGMELGLDYSGKETSFSAKFKTDGFESHKLSGSAAVPLWKTQGWKGSVTGSGATGFHNDHSFSLLLSNDIGKKSQWKVDLGMELSSKDKPKGTVNVVWQFGQGKAKPK